MSLLIASTILFTVVIMQRLPRWSSAHAIAKSLSPSATAVGREEAPCLPYGDLRLDRSKDGESA